MKTNVNFVFLVALVIGAYCCSPKGDGSVTLVDVGGSKMAVFNLNELRTDVATIPLSSLVESCELVQLEFHEDALFNPWFTTVTEKYIGVRPRGANPYVLFDRSGKFLRTIGVIVEPPPA